MLYHSSNKVLFNGDVIRLDSIKNNIVNLEKIKFFDFMTTNLIVKPSSSKLLNPQDVIWHTIYDDEFKERNKLENRIKSKVRWYGKIKCFDDVLKINELSNIIAVSVLLKDINDDCLIVKRGNKNVISSGNFVVSATGSLAVEDLNYDNPFIKAGIREVKEELNLDVDILISNIIIVKQKLQPIVLLEGKIDKPFSSLIDTMKNAADFNFENTNIYAIPANKIRRIVGNYNFSDVSIYQLVGDCSLMRWLFAFKDDINKYKLF